MLRDTEGEAAPQAEAGLELGLPLHWARSSLVVFLSLDSVSILQAAVGATN